MAGVYGSGHKCEKCGHSEVSVTASTENNPNNRYVCLKCKHEWSTREKNRTQR